RPEGAADRRGEDPRRHPRRHRPDRELMTLQQTSPRAYTRILSMGAARGDRIVPNDELAGPIDSSDEWIRQRTGIVTRTRASDGILAVDLAEAAAREALGRAGLDGGAIDTV